MLDSANDAIGNNPGAVRHIIRPANLEHAAANTPATVFEAGSVSKQFTAAAVLLLVERQLSLDDNIRKYFPEIPAYDRPITVRHLLNHTSGLRDWGEIRKRHEEFLAAECRQGGSADALHQHGGEIVPAVRVGPGIARRIIEGPPTSTQWRDRLPADRTEPGDRAAKRGSEWRQDMPFEDVYGNGGLLTTVGDLLKWNANMVSGKLHPAVFETMQKRGTLNGGHPFGYGIGLFLQDFQGLAEVSHSGATAGYRAWLGRIPAKGLSRRRPVQCGFGQRARLRV